MVDRSGIRGIRVGAMPDKLMRHVIEPRVNRMEQVLRAFREGDRHGLLLTLMDDPRSVSLDAARGLIEELLAQPWNEKARQHYR
ncbi:MAG TPA: alpha-glucosidase/alpha-galactosidase, partial [Spirochaetia bacterium]|nr:alpha-glucosidase/alpha-galactosidase [Spirochaetia bacterium]